MPTDLQTVFHDLVRFQIVLWNAVDARLKRDAGLSLVSYENLGVIAAHRECRVNDIADELVITVGGASKIVDRLEASGLCRRRPHPTDRRSSLVELTTEGAAAVERGGSVVDDELRRRLVDVVGEPGLADLAAALAALRASVRPNPKSVRPIPKDER